MLFGCTMLFGGIMLFGGFVMWHSGFVMWHCNVFGCDRLWFGGSNLVAQLLDSTVKLREDTILCLLDAIE